MSDPERPELLAAGGDAACWLARVCAECGALDEAAGATCPRCGAERPGAGS